MECRNFTGQPIYAQITKYLSKGEILRQSRSVGGERYVKKFDGFQHLLVLLFAVFKNYKSLRNPYGSEHGSEAPVARRVYGTAEDEHFLRREQQTAHLPDSRDYEWAQKLSMVKLPKDSFITFDRAYIDYRVFEKFTSRGWSNTWIRIPASAGSCLRTTWN